MSIFFSDVDDTLLNSKSQMTPFTVKVINDYIAAGNTFVVNSGRAISSAYEVITDWGINEKGAYVIGFNGAAIYSCEEGKIIDKKCIDLAIADDLFAMAAERGIHIQTYYDDTIYPSAIDEEMRFYQRKNHQPTQATTSPLRDVPGDPFKVLSIVMDDRQKHEEFAEAVRSKYGDKLNVLFSSPYYLEMFNKDVDKGLSSLWLCNHLGIPYEESYGAGDAMNDYSLVKEVHTGIAMCNGDPKLFEVAQIISEFSNDEDGLAKEILKIMK